MATSTQINALTALYVGYFDRAPDPAGLQFWIDQIDGGREFNTIAADFAASAEAEALYPYLTTPAVSTPSTFVQNIYLNLFGRAAETEGLDFWTGVLEAGSVTVADFIEAIINGAVDAPTATPPTFDKAVLDNKIEVGLDFATDAGNTPGFTFDAGAKAAAVAAVNGVTEDEATVVAAKAATDAFVGGAANPGATLTLTTGSDDLTGTAGDDTFNSPIAEDNTGTLVETLTAVDVIDGGAGSDRLNVTLDGTLTVAPSIQNVEALYLRDTAGATLDLGNVAGAEQLWSDRSTNALAVTNVQNAVALGMNDTNSAFTATYAAGVLGSTTATQTVALMGGVGTDAASAVLTVNAAGGDVITGLTVTNSGDSFVQVDGATAVETLTVTGSGDLELTGGFLNAALDTVEAGTFAGGLTVDLSASTGAEVTTGLGDDNITSSGGDDTIATGAGDDMITIAALGDVSVDAGAGDDTVVITATGITNDDTIDGGAGTDVISVDADDLDDLETELGTGQITNFENLEISGAASAGVAFDNDDFGANEITLSVDVANALTLDNFTGTLTSEAGQSAALNFTSVGASDTVTIVSDADAAATYSDIDVTDIETVTISSDAAADDITITTIEVGGVDTLAFTGAGDVTVSAITDANATPDLGTIDLAALTGVFDNTGAAAQNGVTYQLGDLGDNSNIQLAAGDVDTIVFGSDFDADITFLGVEVGGDLTDDNFDMTALGITDSSQLTLTQNGANTEITSSEFDFTVTLAGVTSTDLNDNDFIFA